MRRRTQRRQRITNQRQLGNETRDILDRKAINLSLQHIHQSRQRNQPRIRDVIQCARCRSRSVVGTNNGHLRTDQDRSNRTAFREERVERIRAELVRRELDGELAQLGNAHHRRDRLELIEREDERGIDDEFDSRLDRDRREVKPSLAHLNLTETSKHTVGSKDHNVPRVRESEANPLRAGQFASVEMKLP